MGKLLETRKPYQYQPKDFEKWFGTFETHRPVFLTGVLDEHLGFGRGERNIERIIKNNRHFCNDLHRRVYTKSKKKIPRVVVIEIGKGRFHSHIVIETPEHLSLSQYRDLLTTSWNRTSHGVDLNFVVGYDKGGLDRYCSKELVHEDTIISQVDAENCCLNQQNSRY